MAIRTGRGLRAPEPPSSRTRHGPFGPFRPAARTPGQIPGEPLSRGGVPPEAASAWPRACMLRQWPSGVPRHRPHKHPLAPDLGTGAPVTMPSAQMTAAMPADLRREAAGWPRAGSRNALHAPRDGGPSPARQSRTTLTEAAFSTKPCRAPRSALRTLPAAPGARCRWQALLPDTTPDDRHMRMCARASCRPCPPGS